MKVKTSELIGPALAYAVGIAEGKKVTYSDLRPHGGRVQVFVVTRRAHIAYDPHDHWSDGGPIIERGGINLSKYNKLDESEPDKWCAHKVVPRPNMEGTTNRCVVAPDGPTPLIAAMRCWVAINLGEAVEIPEELK